MLKRLARWVTSFRAWSPGLLIAAGVLSVGCGTYEPEPEFPQGYAYAPPPPPRSEDLAAQQRANDEARAEDREILIGADDSEYADTDPSALTEWRPVLEDHGTWVDDATYGTVWVPHASEVGSDFLPYVTAGRWSYSEDTSYVWVSDYAWGWVPFHYGRWVHLPGHGWSWIPGRRYAGAWVTWRVGPAGYGYVGWAPTPPTWYWYSGTAVAWSFGGYRHYDHYVYCPRHHLYGYGGPVATHVVRGSAAREHFGRTHDYVPASPGIASGSRVVASPSVAGGERVVASPSVGQRVPAPPDVGRGPRPDEIGVKPDAVLAPPVSHQGLSRARAFASPATATAMGAASPAHVQPREVGIDSARPGAVVARQPATSSFIARDARGLAVPVRPNTTPPPVTSFRSPPPTFRSASPSPFRSSATPTFRSASPPTVHAPATPTFRSPAASTFRSPAASTFRSPAAPTFRSPAAPTFRSPAASTFRSPAATSPSFRSSSPVLRSSPRVSSPPRAASPAVRSLRKR